MAEIASDQGASSDVASRARRRRGPWGWTRLLLIELVVLATLFELGLRFAADRHLGLRRLLYMPGSGTRFEECGTIEELLMKSAAGFRPLVRSGDWVLSSKGLKTTEYAYEKEPGTYRVLAIGDSFTFSSGGVYYRDLWHVQLEALVEEHLQREVEILSLGVPSVATDFELRMWEVEGALLDADLVVLAFYVGNDLSGTRGSAFDLTAVDRWARRSYVARLVRNLARRRAAGPPDDLVEGGLVEGREKFEIGGVPAERPVAWRREHDPESPTMSPEAHDRQLYRRIQETGLRQLHYFEEAIARVVEVLGVFRRSVEGSGADFVLMIIPSEFQVYARERARVLEANGKRADEYDFDIAQRRLSRFCEEEEMHYVDLLSAFRERAEAGERLYRLRNTHWNAAGNTLAVRELSRYLFESGLFED